MQQIDFVRLRFIIPEYSANAVLMIHNQALWLRAIARSWVDRGYGR